VIPVPWLRHEIRRGDIDLHETVEFLHTASAFGLRAGVRRGAVLGRGLLADGIPPWLLAEGADPDHEWPRFAAALDRALAPFELVPDDLPLAEPADDPFSMYRQLATPGSGVLVAPFHQTDPDAADVGTGPMWGMEAPVRPDGSIRARFRHVQQLLLCLEAGGDDYAASQPLRREMPEPPVEVAIRQGATRCYVTVVNGSRVPWTGAVELPGGGELDVRVGPGSVSWAAVEGGQPAAALLAGDAARMGPLTLDAGRAAAARLDEGWRIVAERPCRLRLPAAAGLDTWRIGFDGSCGAAGPDGAVLTWDGGACTVVAGVRPSTTPVDRFRRVSREAAAREARELARLATAVHDPDLADLCDALDPLDAGRLSAVSLPRLRFMVSAGTAPAGTAALLAPLGALVRRLADLSLRDP
jgi:hypothetical protein